MRRPRAFYFGTGLVLAIAGFGSARAQEDIDLRFFKPQIEIGGDGFPSQPFETTDGEYGSRSVSFMATIPLGKTGVRWEKPYRARQFFLHAVGNGASPDLTLPGEAPQRLYTGVLGVSGVFLSRSNNLYVGAVGGSFAEDQTTVHDPSARLAALFLGTHRLHEQVMLIYGGAFTYQFGRPLLVPLLGAVWWINPQWSLAGALPFSIVAGYRPKERLGFRFSLGFAGNQYRVSNEGAFPGEPDPLYLGIVQSRMLAEVEWKASNDVALFAEGGTVRTLSFVLSGDSDGRTDRIIDDNTPASGYLRVGARFTFGKSILDDWKKKEGGAAPGPTVP